MHVEQYVSKYYAFNPMLFDNDIRGLINKHNMAMTKIINRMDEFPRTGVQFYWKNNCANCGVWVSTLRNESGKGYRFYLNTDYFMILCTRCVNKLPCGHCRDKWHDTAQCIKLTKQCKGCNSPGE